MFPDLYINVVSITGRLGAQKSISKAFLNHANMHCSRQHEGSSVHVLYGQGRGSSRMQSWNLISLAVPQPITQALEPHIYLYLLVQMYAED